MCNLVPVVLEKMMGAVSVLHPLPKRRRPYDYRFLSPIFSDANVERFPSPLSALLLLSLKVNVRGEAGTRVSVLIIASAAKSGGEELPLLLAGAGIGDPVHGLGKLEQANVVTASAAPVLACKMTNGYDRNGFIYTNSFVY